MGIASSKSLSLFGNFKSNVKIPEDAVKEMDFYHLFAQIDVFFSRARDILFPVEDNEFVTHSDLEGFTELCKNSQFKDNLYKWIYCEVAILEYVGNAAQTAVRTQVLPLRSADLRSNFNQKENLLSVYTHLNKLYGLKYGEATKGGIQNEDARAFALAQLLDTKKMRRLGVGEDFPLQHPEPRARDVLKFLDEFDVPYKIRCKSQFGDFNDMTITELVRIVHRSFKGLIKEGDHDLKFLHHVFVVAPDIYFRLFLYLFPSYEVTSNINWSPLESLLKMKNVSLRSKAWIIKAISSNCDVHAMTANHSRALFECLFPNVDLTKLSNGEVFAENFLLVLNALCGFRRWRTLRSLDIPELRTPMIEYDQFIRPLLTELRELDPLEDPVRLYDSIKDTIYRDTDQCNARLCAMTPLFNETDSYSDVLSAPSDFIKITEGVVTEYKIAQLNICCLRDDSLSPRQKTLLLHIFEQDPDICIRYFIRKDNGAINHHVVDLLTKTDGVSTDNIRRLLVEVEGYNPETAGAGAGAGAGANMTLGCR